MAFKLEEQDVPGGIFWAKLPDPIGQEDQGEHPWIIISKHQLARTNQLVLAVPMTSNPFQHNVGELEVDRTEFTPNPSSSKPLKNIGGTIKCQKVSHWSTERITEIIGHAKRLAVNRIRGELLELLESSVPPRRQKKRR